MFALVIVQIPFAFIMEAFNIASLMIIKGEVLKTFELSQRQDLAMLFLKLKLLRNITIRNVLGSLASHDLVYWFISRNLFPVYLGYCLSLQDWHI